MKNHFIQLSLKHKIIVIYFVLSFCLLSVSDETPLYIIAIIVLNFANSARLIKRVPMPEEN